jgi:tetratricopeptide (TPR) repeat protein
MKHGLKKKAWPSIFVICSLLYSGCATQKKIPPEQALILPQQHLVAGEYRQAIDAFNSAHRAHPAEKAIQEAFIKCLERVRQSADQAFERKNYSLAEKTYSLLFENLYSIREFQELLSFSKKYLSDRIKDCRVGAAKGRAHQALEAGDFHQALDEMQSLVRIYPGDTGMLTSLVSLSRDIKRTADLALAREDYVAAGKALYALWKDYPLLEKTGAALPFSRVDLDDGIKACRIQLTRKGLEQYRKGNLTEAIFLWQGLLAFDPDNVEIKKAVETAAEQLKKIKKEGTL